uniref:NAD(P)H-hydrate epimerase n=1 Tax=uncultured bacterium Contig1772 TaxID=1393512 RepID=W0FQ70_9BACT|nr:putative G/U mismatch-specific DNA glycosylase [uncultured bacterium Contig1772]
MSSQGNHVEHPLEPVFDGRSRVLVLGTMPSPKSREVGFYYGHPRNRFWRVLAELFDEPVATKNEWRRDQLLRHHIALWDVLASCDIEGASDASIANARPNDLSRILDAAPIEAVFCTGAKSAELYARYCEPVTGMPAVKLPSTSPANAAARFEDIVDAYRAILPHLGEFAPGVFDVPEVVELEQTIARGGTSLAVLMDRAGCSLAYRVRRGSPNARIAILCGNGNNGGDGWVAARELAAAGHDVALVTSRMPKDLKTQPARDTALEILPALVEAKVRVLVDPGESELSDALAQADVVVDAILGTGFSGATVKEPFATWIDCTNKRRRQGARIVSADVPSGLSASTGEASEPCVTADETVTMIVSKVGLESPAAAPYRGELRIAPLAYIEPLLEGGVENIG